MYKVAVDNTIIDSMSVTFTGDIAFSGYFKDIKKDEALLSKNISTFLHLSDHVVANIECPITKTKISSDRALNHVMSPNVIDTLNKMNIDVWNLGNNHILDCGTKGLKDTLKVAKSNNITTLGAGTTKRTASKPIVIGDKIKVGLISLTKSWKHLESDEKNPGTIFLTDTETITAQIKKLKKSKVDYIVAIIHNGNEFSSMPMPYDRNKYLELLDLGIDIIVGHHPHVVQNYEIVNHKIIFYSLGNFIFDTDYQRQQKHTEYGILLKINFEKTRFTWDYIPTYINRKNETVSTHMKPTIFTSINKKAYKRLWPFAAKQFIKNDKKAILYKNPKYKTKNLLKIVRRYLGRLKNPNTRQSEIGSKILSHLKLKRKKYKEIYKYIREKD